MSAGRHPFQRRRNSKKTVVTPFQKEMVRAIEAFSAGARKLTGRQLGLLLGRSSNLASQILNDGLVPSGETVLEIAEVLQLDQERTDRLLRAAMETKVGQRARDAFWLEHTSRMLAAADAEMANLRAFIKNNGLTGAYQEYLNNRKARRSRKPAKE